MKIAEKKVYTFYKDVKLTIEGCTFQQDVQFIFYAEASVNIIRTEFNGVALFEHRNYNESKIENCFFAESMEMICHYKGHVNFCSNKCNEDVIFKGKENVTVDVIHCSVKNGQISVPNGSSIHFTRNPAHKISYFGSILHGFEKKIASFAKSLLQKDENLQVQTNVNNDSNGEHSNPIQYHDIINDDNISSSGKYVSPLMDKFYLRLTKWILFGVLFVLVALIPQQKYLPFFVTCIFHLLFIRWMIINSRHMLNIYRLLDRTNLPARWYPRPFLVLIFSRWVDFE